MPADWDDDEPYRSLQRHGTWAAAFVLVAVMVAVAGVVVWSPSALPVVGLLNPEMRVMLLVVCYLAVASAVAVLWGVCSLVETLTHPVRRNHLR